MNFKNISFLVLSFENKNPDENNFATLQDKIRRLITFRVNIQSQSATVFELKFASHELEFLHLQCQALEIQSLHSRKIKLPFLSCSVLIIRCFSNFFNNNLQLFVSDERERMQADLEAFDMVFAWFECVVVVDVDVLEVIISAYQDALCEQFLIVDKVGFTHQNVCIIIQIHYEGKRTIRVLFTLLLAS